MILLSISSVEEILIYIFIVIFILTAILTLASLPDWIKIPDWYKKKLFTALILEVIGVILLIAKGYVTDGERNNSLYVFPEEYQWVALYENGKSAQPCIKKIDKKDTAFIYLGRDYLEETPELIPKIHFDKDSKIDLFVESKNGVKLGKLSSTSLYNAGLFNWIRDVSSPAHYTNIRWEKQGSKWEKVNKTSGGITMYGDFLDKEVVFQVYSDGSDKYRIYNSTDTVYHSRSDEFDVAKRSIHFCKNSQNDYFLFRITSAVLYDSIKTPFVNILQIKLEPQLNFEHMVKM